MHVVQLDCCASPQAQCILGPSTDLIRSVVRGITDPISIYVSRVTFVCLFDLILYVPSKIFQLNRDGSS